jgi:hypothetical protein
MCICTWLRLIELVAGEPAPANFPVQTSIVSFLGEQKRLQCCGMMDLLQLMHFPMRWENPLFNFATTPSELAMLKLRRSLFVVADVKAGETFTEKNVRSIRPGHGLHPRHVPAVLGRKAACEVCSGTPLKWEMVAGAPASARETA